MTVWDPDALSRIQHLHLVATRVVDGLLHGNHRSTRVGPNVEFADYKEYSPGDPIRDLDWRVLGKADRYVVRRYEAETDLACYIIFDASGDLSTGRRGPYGRPPIEGSKFGYALTLTATLAYFLHRQQEPIGLMVMGGEGQKNVLVPARSGRSHLAQIFGVLASLVPGGRADLGRAIASVAPRVRRRSLVAVVSDFMEEPEGWVSSLGALAKRRTDLVAFHVLDRQEMSLDFEQPTIFYSPEGGGDLVVDPVTAAPDFAGVVSEFLTEVRGAVVTNRGRYYASWTDRSLESVMRPMIHGVIEKGL